MTKLFAQTGPKDARTEGERVRQSISEMRRIYPEKTVDEFIVWYRRIYKAPADMIRKVLKEVDGG